MVVRKDPELTITRQCELFGIGRSTASYVPRVSGRKLDIMTYMDEIYTDDPSSGQRKIKAALEECVRRESMRSTRSRTLPYPIFSIRNTPICCGALRQPMHANQVWSTDITYPVCRFPLLRFHGVLCSGIFT
ncbi:hypothetical protein SAMN05720766_109116 [Fibrobacter sp. UWH9]|nr:hypothetical protein SAMN05720766_109116 [Fibrobacter sp. UWH9]